ncbi:MAG: hypothetical protein ACC628_08160, partial [Pirellulaceae bacterium]
MNSGSARNTLFMVFGVACAAVLAAENDASRIKPWPKNPQYWQYQGEPVVLLGGTKDDNLFQLPDLEKHLDELARVGGNYIRNTMSDRNDHGFEVYPYKRLPNGKYDLDQWNDEYWKRFERMLQLTRDRHIIVQIEVWDRFDYSDQRGGSNWKNHPYNPRNNINYTAEEIGLKTTYPKHPGANEQPFFYTVPRLKNNQKLLRYQVARVDKMLSYALRHGNVLYCMDNETSGSPEWGRYWSQHIRKRAAEAGVDVHTTEMWDQWNPLGEGHKHTFDHPEQFSFVDVSQNNHNKGQQHWDNLLAVRHYVSRPLRPVNTVKIYGADTGRYGNSRDGEERFWRNIFGGCAGTRFHRPDSGLGLSERSKPHIRSMRLLLDEFDIYHSQPDGPSRLLGHRKDNEAYLTFIDGEQYALYFPDGGEVSLNLSKAKGDFDLKWIEITAARWKK